MIKILKEGEIPEPKKYIYKISCYFCNCEFEFELEDCLDVERCPNGHVTVECPCCHKHIAKRRGELESMEIEKNSNV